MIYVLSLTPSLDRTVTCPSFDAEKTNRVAPLREDLGGKGVNCARVLRALNAEVTLCGADFEGRVEKELRGKMPLLLTESGKRLRCNLKIFDQARKKTVEVNESAPPLEEKVWNKLRQQLDGALLPGDVLVLSGSLPEGAPADTYRAFCRLAHEKGALAAADCSGAALKAVLEAEPDLIKPNREEFLLLLKDRGVSLPDETPKGLVPAAQALCRAGGARRVLISLGKDGALLVTETDAFFCEAPDVTVRGDIGAGDAMTALAVLCLSRGEDGLCLLQKATAAAGAVLEKEGTQPPEEKDIERVLRLVRGR